MMTLTQPLISKRCNTCKQTLAAELFYKESRNKSGLYGSCKSCTDKRTKQWQKDNRNKVREYNLKSKYNLSTEEFKQMFEAQEGKCAICQTTDPGKANFCVDHCHTTGKVRGLLCDSCNTALGKFNDDITRIQNAISYLEAATDF